ncbi:hypothetical protein DL96DRAFT_1553129 [Flagelloscypha sp. PMI_526]|nr:hypothetical protein DL96DRAFT_1553129 [Flagelloscypha sp. PMI_526]
MHLLELTTFSALTSYLFVAVTAQCLEQTGYLSVYEDTTNAYKGRISKAALNGIGGVTVTTSTNTNDLLTFERWSDYGEYPFPGSTVTTLLGNGTWASTNTLCGENMIFRTNANNEIRPTWKDPNWSLVLRAGLRFAYEPNENSLTYCGFVYNPTSIPVYLKVTN